MRDTTTKRLRGASLVLLLVGLPAWAGAQARDTVELSPNYWGKLGLGVTASILLHEAAHVATSVIVGGHPSFGFDALRPTVYSGINSHAEPRRQFFFSISGLAVQNVLDEAILDIPHHRGSAFERGLLGGGIGTTLFYLTVGRRGSVSDVDFIARTHVMSITQVTVAFGAITAVHTFRVSRNPSYANFFARPRSDGGMDLGMSLKTR